MAVILIAVGIGCFLGIRAAGSAVKQHQAAQEESRQELLEASRVEESAQAQAAVAHQLRPCRTISRLFSQNLSNPDKYL